MKKYIVTLDASGRIYFNDSVVEDLNQLKGKLQYIPAGDDTAMIVMRDVEYAREFCEELRGIVGRPR